MTRSRIPLPRPGWRLLVLLLPPFLGARAGSGQVGEGEPPSPVVVADEFNRGFQSMAWPGLVQRIHPRGLADLRLAADILVAADSSGYVLDTLLGGADAGSYADLPDDEVVRRLLSGIQSQVPGLLSSLVSRRTETLGSVPEGELRHVVYRIQAQVSGSVPETRVMTLERSEGRWKVVEAEDLRVLHTAIRGIPIPRGPESLVLRPEPRPPPSNAGTPPPPPASTGSSSGPGGTISEVRRVA